MAFEVADAYQGRGIGSALAQELVCDACAAGNRRGDGTRAERQPRALAVLQRALGQLEVRLEGPEMLVRAPLPAAC